MFVEILLNWAEGIGPAHPILLHYFFPFLAHVKDNFLARSFASPVIYDFIGVPSIIREERSSKLALCQQICHFFCCAM